MSGTTLTAFTAGDLVISEVGDVENNGTYGLDQASPIFLQELTTTGTVVGTMVLPQATTVVNGVTEYGISGEYGSASEGSLQLSGDGQSLVIAGYGVSAANFDASNATSIYGTNALGQTTSIQNGTVTAVPRVVADIGFNGSISTSTALYNVFNTNNPRSVYTQNGTSFYLAGQGVSGDTTQGVFYARAGASGATAIDTSTDARFVTAYNGQLYVSRDSTQNTSSGTDIGTYGTTLPTSATTQTPLPGIDESITLTAAQENSVNASAVGTTVNLSPENFFFASPTVLYVADSGLPKNGGVGDGGLQKWVLNSGTWTLEYTLSLGLNLVNATSALSGTTGLIGLTGTVVNGGTVELFATTEAETELGQSYLVGITDPLSATTNTGSSFTTLETAPNDVIIRGVAFAPTSQTVVTSSVVVNTGTTSSGVTISSGSTLEVMAGGTAVSATVVSGGLAIISAGGVDLASEIAQGGTEQVSGTVAGDFIGGTQIVNGSSAAISNEIVMNGGTVGLLAAASPITGMTVTTGGTIDVGGNTTLGSTAVNGGGIVLASPSATVSGTLSFINGGTLEIDTLISAGFGASAVISGFGPNVEIDFAAISSGATLSTTSAGGDTVLTVSSGGVSQSVTLAGTIPAQEFTLTPDGQGGVEITTPTVSSGVTSTGYVVIGETTLNVLSGGTVVSMVVQSGGSATIEGGGVESATTILAGGNETMIGTGTLDVVRGLQSVEGTVANELISSGATVTVVGVDSASTIAAGGTQVVLGSATADAVSGIQDVSGGTAVVANETVYNGGTVELFLAGAVGSGITTLSGGEIAVSGHATLEAGVLSGGIVELQSPKATISGTLTFAGSATLEETATIDPISGGVSFGDQALNVGFGAGDVIDFSSATSIGAAGAAALLNVTTSGGDTVATVTGDGSVQSFTFAGTLLATSLSLTGDGHGGEELIFGSATSSSTTVTISNGVSSGGLTVSSGGAVIVQSGGTISATTVLSGGQMVISAGGIDSGSTIAQGGTEIVSGSVTGDLISGVQTVSNGSATAASETVFNGGIVNLFSGGATATAITVSSGGTLNINGNATASNIAIDGGGLVDMQSTSASLGGSLTFSGTGGDLEFTAATAQFASANTVLISGFGVGDVIDEQTISTGASLATSTSGGDTIATLTSATKSSTVSAVFSFAGSIASNLQLGFDGIGGSEIFFANTTTTVTSGVTSSLLNITSGNAAEVLSGGKMSGTTVQAGGSAVVQLGGIDSGSTILAGGNEGVLGSATKDQVFGTQQVASGATVTSETVFNGGAVDLFIKGGVATALTVNSGGHININGNAVASNTVLNGGTLDLQSPKATTSGTLTFSGTGGVLEEDAVVTSAGVGPIATISGFAVGDEVLFTSTTSIGTAGSAATLSVTTSGGNTVATVSGGGSTQAITFAGTTIGSQLSLLVTGGSVELVACFAEGTQIATTRGEVAVEDLRVGDLVPTMLGDDVSPIIWIGRREMDCAHHPKPKQVWPVRISAGAFGPGAPHSDLLLSPDHAVHVGEVLIPVKYLINGTTIAQVPMDRITYYHIELPQHDVVLAQGLQAESYLEMKDGWNYRDPSGATVLRPDFVSRMWEALGCAPLVVTGPELAAARAMVAACDRRPEAA